jgi:hypothetical protein
VFVNGLVGTTTLQNAHQDVFTLFPAFLIARAKEGPEGSTSARCNLSG